MTTENGQSAPDPSFWQSRAPHPGRILAGNDRYMVLLRPSGTKLPEALPHPLYSGKWQAGWSYEIHPSGPERRRILEDDVPGLRVAPLPADAHAGMLMALCLPVVEEVEAAMVRLESSPPNKEASLQARLGEVKETLERSFPRHLLHRPIEPDEAATGLPIADIEAGLERIGSLSCQLAADFGIRIGRARRTPDAVSELILGMGGLMRLWREAPAHPTMTDFALEKKVLDLQLQFGWAGADLRQRQRQLLFDSQPGGIADASLAPLLRRCQHMESGLAAWLDSPDNNIDRLQRILRSVGHLLADDLLPQLNQARIGAALQGAGQHASGMRAARIFLRDNRDALISLAEQVRPAQGRDGP